MHRMQATKAEGEKGVPKQRQFLLQAAPATAAFTFASGSLSAHAASTPDLASHSQNSAVLPLCQESALYHICSVSSPQVSARHTESVPEPSARSLSECSLT